MIDPHSIAFDFDGVIADTMTLFIDIARNDYNVHHIRYEDITCYSVKDCLKIDDDLIETIFRRIQDGSYTIPLTPVEGSVEVLARLVNFSSQVLSVTARPYAGPVQEWFKNILPMGNGAVKLIATGSFEGKADILIDQNITHFVEDRLETCFQLKEAGVEPILFRQPWNRKSHPFHEVGSWHEINSLINWKKEDP